MNMPSNDILVKLYRDLLTARRLETALYETRGGHRGPGEEAIPIAFCNNLTRTDSFFTNYRTQFCMFTKPGYTLVDVVAQVTGRHLDNSPWDAPHGGIVPGGGTLGEAAVRYVGAAAAITIQKTDDIVVFIQGDGASNRAPTHEAMAVAAAWQLPIIFVIQNNRYGMGTAVETAYNIEDLSVRGLGYGFPSERVDGNDIVATYQVAQKHIERCRAGGGPSLIAADSYRLRGHNEHDPQIYRPVGEVEAWMKKEPLGRYQKQLMDIGLLTQADVERLEEEVDAEIRDAFAAAEKLPRRTAEAIENSAIDGL